MTTITLNGTQIGHGDGLCAALLMATDEGRSIHPRTVQNLYNGLYNGHVTVKDIRGTYQVRTEPALTAEMVRDWSASGVKFGEVAK